MLKIVVLFFVAFLKGKHGLTPNKVECGYKQCPPTRDGALNVHLVPHSHMDAGWVKTFEEYYYGAKTTISSASVQLIFHSVLSELLHDKRRKFTFSEAGYFWRWWKEQRPATRATFRSLVQEGRVEFAGGGWVQSDEAAVDYMMLLDQYTWGLRKLNDTLGSCGKPKAAWQIDAYGHTREHTSLLAQMGYDGLFIGRVDHKEREAMLEEGRMEFIWRGSDILGKMSDIMTHTLYNLYNAPEGFCFDFLCNEEPIVDDLDSRVYNAERRVNDFITQIERQAKYYEHDNIIVTMGGDFTYQSAAHWFMNMDKLINHVNTHPANISDVNIFYSTPSCFLKSLYLHGRRDKAIFTEKGDHMPYGSDANTYWTGFYTSRPSLKYLARQAHSFLQVLKQLTVLARMGDSYELHLLRHAVALMTHHDAITGTSQQHVVNDYVRVVSDAIDAGTKKVSTLLSHLTPTWGGTRRPKSKSQFITCHQMNISQCSFAETQDSILMIVYNPLSVKTYHYVRLPAIALHYTVRNPNDEEVEYQLVPLPSLVINLPGRNSNALQELVFEAENIPPLGYLAYYIAPVRDQLEENEYAKKQKLNPETEIVTQISNEYLRVTVNKETGLLESVQHIDGVTVLVSQNFYYYAQGHRALRSGAYSFRPENDRPTPLSDLLVVDKVSYSCVRGALVKEVRQRFSDWLHQTLRVYRGEEFLEMEWLVGPVPIGTDLGKEIVTVFSTNISNRGEFYTDSNMRQAIRRSCWNDTAGPSVKKPVASCYYPVTGRLCIQAVNGSTGLCVLPDRTQGGTSYGEGEIELMIHRRLLTDDGFGLDESLNEEEAGAGLVVRGKHRLYFGNYRQEVEELSFSERMSQAARRWRAEPWQFLAAGDQLHRRKWRGARNKRFSALRARGLPRHARLLTLEPWRAGAALLRLENTLERTDRPNGPRSEMAEEFPKPSHINVDLRKLFQHMQIKSVRETTLAANQWLDEARQMDWSSRYVYSGGDDGLPPEDMDYTEDKSKPTDTRDSSAGHYSDEDDFSRQRPSREKVKSKLRKYNVNQETPRKRRFVSTDNTVDNEVLNVSEFAENSRKYTTERTKVDEKITTTVNVTKLVSAESEQPTAKEFSTNTPKSFRRRKQKKQLAEYSGPSEEEQTLMKKQARRKSPRKKQPAALFAEMDPDAADDGVTKSIYEMYYKTKAKIHSFRPYLRSSEEAPEPAHAPPEPSKRKRKFRSKEFEERMEGVTRRSKKANRKDRLRVDVPFFLTGVKVGATSTEGLADRSGEDRGEDDESEELEEELAKRRKRSPSEEDDDDDDDMDEDDYTEPERVVVKRKRRTSKRRKRSAKDATPEAEPEFVVTLRPTQIRTFVVRFESVNKKHHI